LFKQPLSKVGQGLTKGIWPWVVLITVYYATATLPVSHNEQRKSTTGLSFHDDDDDDDGSDSKSVAE